MTDAEMLTSVKNALGITGEYQDATISEYIGEVTGFLTDAGVSAEHITPGIVARGVSDLWTYGGGNGTLSEYFKMRAVQLALKGGGTNG